MKSAHVVLGFQSLRCLYTLQFCTSRVLWAYELLLTWHGTRPVTCKGMEKKKRREWPDIQWPPGNVPGTELADGSAWSSNAGHGSLGSGQAVLCWQERSGFWSNAGPGLASLLPQWPLDLSLRIADFLRVSDKSVWTQDIVEVTAAVLTAVSKRITRHKLMEVEVLGPTTTWSECICLGLSHVLGDSARCDTW